MSPVDIDGQTPLHVACWKGNIDLVKFLVSKGANIYAMDARGLLPVDEARQSNFTAGHQFLDSIIEDKLIKDNCQTFGQGIFKQGLHQAIGNFHKKFAD